MNILQKNKRIENLKTVNKQQMNRKTNLLKILYKIQADQYQPEVAF